MDKYDDILYLNHPTSKNHTPMSIYDRSAQFAPFAALVGYDESIDEASRITDAQIELSEDKINEIGHSLLIISQNIQNNVKVSITYFKKDKSKNGGKYISSICNVKKIDVDKKIIVLETEKVSFDCILDISIISW